MGSTIERASLTAPAIPPKHCVATSIKAGGRLDGVGTVIAEEQTKQV